MAKNRSRTTRRRFGVVAALAFLVAPGVGHAQEPLAPPPVQVAADAPIATGRRAPQVVLLPIPLEIDARDAGEIDAEVGTAGAAVDPQPLVKALDGRISATLAARLAALRQPNALTPLAAIAAAGLDVAFDPDRMIITVTTPLDGAPVQTFSVASQDEPDPARSLSPAMFSAAANLSGVLGFVDGERRPATVNATGFASVGRKAGLTLTYDLDYAEGERDPWRRNAVRLVRDDAARAIRYSAGDVDPRAYGLQSAPRLEGVSIARAYTEIRPFETLYERGAARFTLERESRVTIQTEGASPITLRLPRGQYDLRDIAQLQGRNNVRVTAEDAAGLRTLAEVSLWSDPTVFAPGVTDFSIAVGRLPGGDKVAATGFYRRGLTPRITGAVGLDTMDGAWLGQADMTTTVGGTAIQLSTALSSNSGLEAGAVSGVVRRTFDFGPRNILSVYGAMTASQPGFASPFGRLDSRARPRGASNATLNASYTAGHGGVSAYVSRIADGDRTSVRYGADAYRSVGPVSFAAGVGRDSAGGSGLDLRFTISLRTGPKSLPATVTVSKDQASVQIDRSRGSGMGSWSLGSGASIQSQERASLNARGAYQANRFRASFDQSSNWDHGLSHSTTTVAASTAIAFADGAFAMGRPIGDAFLIATRHPSLRTATATIGSGAGMTSFLGGSQADQKPQARSGVFGAPLVSLRPYTQDTVDVSAENLPDGYDLGAVTPTVVPRYGKGYVVRLGRDNWRAALGTLVTPDGPVASLRLSIVRLGDANAAPQSAFTNGGGRFYVDGLAEGAYAIRAGDVQIATFDIPRNAPALVDLGVIHASSF